LRFSEEHGFRFWKQDVLWTAVHGRTPTQFLLWRWLVALVFTQVDVVRPEAAHALLPWEARGRPVTPRQIRRVMPTMLSHIGTPTRPCHPRGTSPGRAKGFHPKPATRHPVIYKTSHTKKKGAKVTVT
jgi:hypothetical protein